MARCGIGRRAIGKRRCVGDSASSRRPRAVRLPAIDGGENLVKSNADAVGGVQRADDDERGLLFREVDVVE